MNHTLEKSIGMLSTVILSGLGCTSPSSLAQSEPESSWIEVRVIQVRPDMVEEWRELQKNGINPALQKAGTPWRGAWRSATFGNSYEWTFVTPIQNFAEYDTQDDPFPEGLIQKVDQCHMGRQVYALLAQSDLSKMRDMSTPPELAIVTTERLLPGKDGEYRELVESEILPAMKQADHVQGYEVYRSIFGGPVEWVSVLFMASFEEIDKGPTLRRTLGAERSAQISAKRDAMRTYVERTIGQYDAELSFSSTPASSN